MQTQKLRFEINHNIDRERKKFKKRTKYFITVEKKQLQSRHKTPINSLLQQTLQCFCSKILASQKKSIPLQSQN
jgi:uncharacterized membrane-anchored protein